MPKEAEKPNSERAPELPRARLPDTRAAKAVAAILAASIPATSFSRPNEATFINSGNRNSNGETMVQAQAPQGIRAAAEDLSRLSSDPSVSAVVRSGNQNLLLQRANDLMAALDGTGQPYRREVMLGGVRDQRAWSDRYSSLTEEQKLAFRDQAILMMAQNFGEQFSANQAVRINEAFGGVVQQNLESLFAQATAAPAETTMAPGSRPWLESIPIVGSLFRRRGAEEVVPTPVQQPQGEITEDEINSFIASQREAGADFSEFENYRLTLEDVLALTYLDRAYTFFTSTPNPTPEQVLAFYEGVLVAGQMTSRQNGREAATLEDVDRYIQAGLGSVGIGGAASRFLAAITSTETRMVERVAQNLYNYVYERRMAGVSGAPGEIPYDRAARAAARDARQTVQGLFDKIRSVPPEARGALNMNALLAEAGVAQDAMESMLARGSRERLMDMNRLNSIIRSPQFADPNSVRMVLEDGLPKVNIIRGSFTAAFDEAFIAPWRMVSEAWRGESSTLARVINAGGSVFAALTYRPLARGLRTTFGPRRAIGERVGGAAGLAVYGLVGWQVASWLGATERGPFTLAYNSLFGSSGASAPSAGVTAPPRPDVRAEAAPALTEAQQRLETANGVLSLAQQIISRHPHIAPQIAMYLRWRLGTAYNPELGRISPSELEFVNEDGLNFAKQWLDGLNRTMGPRAPGTIETQLLFYREFFRTWAGAEAAVVTPLQAIFSGQDLLGMYQSLYSVYLSRLIRGEEGSAELMLDTLFENPAFSNTFKERYGGVAGFIEANSRNASERTSMYRTVMEAISAQPGISDNDILEKMFSSAAPMLSPLASAYFANIFSEGDLLDLMQARLNIARAQELNLGAMDDYTLQRAISTYISNLGPSAREIVEEIESLYPVRRGEGRNSAEAIKRGVLLLDLALFMDRNPQATFRDALSHFERRFDNAYPGQTALDGISDEKLRFRVVLSLLAAIQDEATGRFPTTARMEGELLPQMLKDIAGSERLGSHLWTQCMHYIVENEALLAENSAFIRSQYDRAFNEGPDRRRYQFWLFFYLPEDRQRELWEMSNATIRNDVWNTQVEGRPLIQERIDAWKEEHSNLMRTTRRGEPEPRDWPAPRGGRGSRR